MIRKHDKLQTVSNQFNDIHVETAYELAGGNLAKYFVDSESIKDGVIKRLGDSKKNLNKIKDADLGNLFAVSGFELFDLTPNLPLVTFFHQGTMPVRVGGGFAETVSALRLNFALAKKRLASGNSNQVEVTDALPEKITVPAYTFKYGLVIGQVDYMKSAQVAYDIYGYKLEAIRLSYQRELDYFAFVGNEGINGIASGDTRFVAGLFNQDITAQVGHEVASSDWLSWGVDTWVEYFAKAFTYLLVLNQYNRDIVPDTVVLPPEVWQSLAKPAVVGTLGVGTGAGVAVSVIGYLVEALRQRVGFNVSFKENPYLSKNATKNYTVAGIVANGSTKEGRIVLYRNSDRALRMNITMPLMAGQLAWSPTEDGYRQNHLSVVTPPMVIFPTSIYYLDNFATEYAVTYELDGGTNGSNPAKFVKTDLPITLANATKASNTFGGWFLDAGLTQQVTQITEAKAIKLYAKFTLS